MKLLNVKVLLSDYRIISDIRWLPPKNQTLLRKSYIISYPDKILKPTIFWHRNNLFTQPFKAISFRYTKCLTGELSSISFILLLNQQLTTSGSVGVAAPTWIALYGASSGWPFLPSPTEKEQKNLMKHAKYSHTFTSVPTENKMTSHPHFGANWVLPFYKHGWIRYQYDIRQSKWTNYE